MKQRQAAKIINNAMEGRAYRETTVARAASRMRRRRLWSSKRLRYSCAALAVAFMVKLECSLNGVRFWMDSQQFYKGLEAIDRGSDSN